MHAPKDLASPPVSRRRALSLLGLGVHEHWNDPVEKKYSRNLGTGPGIELVRAGPEAPGKAS